MKKTILTTLLILFLVSLASYIFILYGKGYRLDLTGKGNKIVAGTGLLVITSTPNGARAYVNDNLTTATDDTLNLPPGEYDIRIEKDGYYPWRKHVILKKEAVTKTDAVLFPTTPKLEATTYLGAENPVVDTGGSFIAYQVSSSSAQNNGIYILSINRPFLSLGSSSRQLASDKTDTFSKAVTEFSPDGSELLATIKTLNSNRIYLLKTDTSNDNPQNVTFTVGQVRLQWDELKKQQEEKFAKSLPQASRAFILANFSNLKLSPEGDKILYIASESAQMPQFIIPTLPSTNSTPETRNLKKGSAYVYQIKEDKNYLFYSSDKTLPQLLWYPSSAHIIFIEGKRIVSMEYDGGNKTTLYSGPFDPTFIYPWPDSSGLIIKTNLNDETVPANLYKVGLR
jgi:hypothetical protein